MPLIFFLHFFYYYYISYTPNLYLFTRNLIWCIKISASLLHLLWKYMIWNKLHLMGGIYKKVWWWDFIIKFPFWWINHFYPRTSWWMLENGLHCAGIITYNDINDKISLEECIFYYLHNCTSLYTFISPLKVLWQIMLFWLFYSLISGITLCGWPLNIRPYQ